MSYPYTEEQWQQIDALGHRVEAELNRLGVGLTMGGEPTFVSTDDFESLQWKIAALGEEKRELARKLLGRLGPRFSGQGGLLHHGQGKWYPGEALPRWALACYWREDGVPLWRNPKLLALEGKDYGHTQQEVALFIQALIQGLGISPKYVMPAYEPDTNELAGYTLPILAVRREEKGQAHWQSCHWTPPENRLQLTPGYSPLGLRLPLGTLLWAEDLEEEAMLTLDSEPITPHAAPVASPDNSIRVALSVEVRDGLLHVFLPPFSSARGYADLIAAIENSAQETGIPVLIEGYPPLGNAGIIGFQITPDPGVLEVNIQPAADWQELVKIHTILHEEAEQCGLGIEKYTQDGRRVDTGGGSHITIGGQTTAESPLLRHPDLLRSLISYWQNHPSLSYLFAGLFVGPTSQAPRVDEARHESLYELEIAFQSLKPGQAVPPSLVDRLLRNLLVDVTGNTHRAAFCIDKLFPIENYRTQMGLLEFRAFAMPPHVQMSLLQMLLIRTLVAWFWEKPYTERLIRWGTTLHDRFMLPYYLEEDLKEVVADLEKTGYPFSLGWFEPFFEFRFPRYGEVTFQEPDQTSLQLELRHAIEPWHVLGEETTGGMTARYVDSSMERLQVTLRGALGSALPGDHFSTRYVVICNGRLVPLKSTGRLGEYVAGVRFRARQFAASLHPAIDPHSPLVFDLIDTQEEKSLGGCIYHVNQPNGEPYEKFPTNHQEAAARMKERFIPLNPTAGKVRIPTLHVSSEYPLTLDLRQAVASEE
ncbi:MAG: transglutaminase family protein [Gloeobacterales cyanobacterium]